MNPMESQQIPKASNKQQFEAEHSTLTFNDLGGCEAQFLVRIFFIWHSFSRIFYEKNIYILFYGLGGLLSNVASQTPRAVCPDGIKSTKGITFARSSRLRQICICESIGWFVLDFTFFSQKLFFYQANFSCLCLLFLPLNWLPVFRAKVNAKFAHYLKWQKRRLRHLCLSTILM